MTENTAAKGLVSAQVEAQELVQGVETPFGENIVTHLVVPSDVADKRYVSVGGGGAWHEKVK
ncbi:MULTISPECIES: hypothetical protein [Pseudomonas]|uniref:Uncharacterized protein n=2 Tax=Pseudomonas TaxID=286 RepID=A0ABT5PTN0_9PSED|nr:hypothetical protein [Pseudomonas aphyarum]MDD0969008.1 hypothetical protein [Pseudomonas aphyarum]MDD1126841.1 hypothetical protein [Pseudomonas aphyarum]